MTSVQKEVQDASTEVLEIWPSGTKPRDRLPCDPVQSLRSASATHQINIAHSTQPPPTTSEYRVCRDVSMAEATHAGILEEEQSKLRSWRQ